MIASSVNAVLVLCLATSVPAFAQAGTPIVPPVGTAGESATVARAVRAATPPRIDGRGDDPVWRTVPLVGEFQLFAPREGGRPAFHTEARVAYDDRALYVLVRAEDPHPDSLVRRLARRDTDGPPNDQVLLFIDPFHDRRSGYELIVNPAGVKSDYLLSDDTNEDQSWDGVWDVATSVDSLGWVAEFAIPLQQLRFSNYQAPVFGLTIGRWVGRNDERSSWPQYRRSRAGLVSQLGTLVGLKDLARPASLELTPYLLGRARNTESRGLVPRPAIGGDLRYQPRPTIALSATINPDFGQIEADPAILNLTGIEVFQAERRPFFLEGSGLLRFPLAGDASALLFYSRRIGRRPALADLYGGTDSPTETTILGAAKGTARLGASTSLFALSAVTQREAGGQRPGGGPWILEPQAYYGVARVQHDFRAGRSGIGLMLTRVNRSGGDSVSSALLPSTAQAGALTFQHQTRDGAYQLSGWAAASDVDGSPSAMSLLQLSNVHAFQRPDAGVRFDPTRTALRGTAGYLFAGKAGGGVTRFGLSYRRISAGFDVNEMGFLSKSGIQSASMTAGLNASHAGTFAGMHYRRASATLGFGGDWLVNGLPQGRGFSLDATMELPSQIQLQLNAIQQLPGAYCTITCTRGGPALVDPPHSTVILTVRGDPRRTIIPQIAVEWDQDEYGRSNGFGPQVDVTWRPRSNLDLSASVTWFDAHYDNYFYQRFGAPLADTAHYTVGQLELPTRSLTTRMNYALTTTLTLQWYAQAYLSRGTYTRIRELSDPRARNYEARFRPYADTSVTNHPGGVDFRQFRSNLVARWEYRPGSTLFLVWTQGRDLAAPGTGPIRIGRDLDGLFGQPARNVFAVKLSYWLNPRLTRVVRGIPETH
ncbi:MAG TPA: DUF5916 domain-containing protein [Gemmatimonadales bacterium]|nr:DUF5916 domain-containing protein [Gemmatimonadales bacterium]